MHDYPALEEYNAKRASGWNLNVWDTVRLADDMKEEFKARIKALEANVTYWMEQAEDQVELIQRVKALEAELAAERGRVIGTHCAICGGRFREGDRIVPTLVSSHADCERAAADRRAAEDYAEHGCEDE